MNLKFQNCILKLDKKLAKIKTFIGKSIDEEDIIRMQEFVKSIKINANDFEKTIFKPIIQSTILISKQAHE